MNSHLTQQNIHYDKNAWVYRRQSDGMNLLPHWHTHYEILLIYRGFVRVFSGGKTYTCAGPCVILYRPFTLHGMFVLPDGIYERSMVNIGIRDAALFPENLLSFAFLGSMPLLIVPLDRDQEAELDALYKSLFAYRGEFARTRLYIALMIHFIRCTAERKNLLTAGTVQRPYISDVLQYISENLGDPLRLEETASHFDVGRTKLNEDLRQVTGMTFKQYLTSLRMARAKEMLEEGVSVAQTAMECGYSSESNFIRTYRCQMGYTPGRERTRKPQ